MRHGCVVGVGVTWRDAVWTRAWVRGGGTWRRRGAWNVSVVVLVVSGWAALYGHCGWRCRVCGRGGLVVVSVGVGGLMCDMVDGGVSVRDRVVRRRVQVLRCDRGVVRLMIR